VFKPIKLDLHTDQTLVAYNTFLPFQRYKQIFIETTLTRR